MRKFLAVVLAVTIMAVSSIPAYAVTSVPVSSLSNGSINSLLQFNTGDNNFVVPVSSSTSDYLTKFLYYVTYNYSFYIPFNSSESFSVKFFARNYLQYKYTSSPPYFTFSKTTNVFSFNLVFDDSLGCYKITSMNTIPFTTSSKFYLAPFDNSLASYIFNFPNLRSDEYILDVSSITFVDNASYVPPSKTHTLTVNYLYSQDNPAANPVTQELAPGEEYSIPSPEIEGYTPSIPLVTGTMPEEDLTIDVYYSKSFYPLTVKYQYQDGSKAADDVTQQHPFGFTYDIPSPEIEGHTPDKSSVSGIMPDGPLSEVVTYTPNSYNLRIDYLHLDGSQTAESYFQELPFGTKYAVPSPQLEGYYPNQSMITGTMRSHNVSYTVTYRPDSTGGSSGGGGADPDDGGGDGSGDGGGGEYDGDDPFEGVDPPDFSGDDPFTGVNPPDFTGDDPFSGISSPEFSGFDPFKMPSSFDNVKTDFLAFSPEYLYEMVGHLRENIGAIVSVAFHSFFVVIGIFLIRNIVGNIVR